MEKRNFQSTNREIEKSRKFKDNYGTISIVNVFLTASISSLAFILLKDYKISSYLPFFTASLGGFLSLYFYDKYYQNKTRLNDLEKKLKGG